MKTHTTNYFDTFILIAADSPTLTGQAPPIKNGQKTAAQIQFDLIKKSPYQYTSDEVLFQVYAKKNDLTKAEYKTEREKFFSKGQPCFRASPLSKRYGWGVHFNAAGKMAIYGAETKEYQQLSKDQRLKILKAMKTTR